MKAIFTTLLSLQLVIILLKTCGVEPINSWSPWLTWASMYIPIFIVIISAFIAKLIKK